MMVTQKEIQQAKQYDLLAFLRVYNPQDLVKESCNSYCLKSHSSLKISTTNNLWYQFSTETGGRSALDYLIKIEGLQFTDAVKMVNRYCSNLVADNEVNNQKVQNFKGIQTLKIPLTDQDIDSVRRYLNDRGISNNVIDYCREKGLIKQESRYKNAMFCGYDYEGQLKYISVRGTINNSKYKGIVSGSDKQYSFRFIPDNIVHVNALHIFEAVVDLLSYATILDMGGADFRDYIMLSLDGVSAQYAQLPKALDKLLYDFPHIQNIVLHFDRDEVGLSASKSLSTILSGKYSVITVLPKHGKDVNDELMYFAGESKKQSIKH